jgi:hypothetical protein
MAGKIATSLKGKVDAAWSNLTRQVHGMEPHLERAEGPGEWTTREVLCHLLLPTGANLEATLKSFAEQNLPLIEIEPGKTYITDERRKMSLKQLMDGLDGQRRQVCAYIDSLPDEDLQERKARIPLFKGFFGTDEIPLGRYVGAMFDYHWNDHAGQLAKIRAAAGLPAAS